MKHVVKSLYVDIKREEYDALRARVVELEAALNQAHMALAGYLPGHRNAITDAAIESAGSSLKSQQPSSVMDERTAIQTTPFMSSTGENRNPIYEGQFDDESPEQSAARLHWARVAIEMARAAQPATGVGVERKLLERIAREADHYDDSPLATINDNCELWQIGHVRLKMTVGDLRELRTLLAQQEVM